MTAMNCASCKPVSCCGCPAASRRSFLKTAALAASALPFTRLPVLGEPARQQPIRTALKVQPVLMYQMHQRREATSWRSWGGLHTEQDVAQEKARIGRELTEMKSHAGFALDVLPLQTAETTEQAAAIAGGGHDVLIQYAASGGVKTLEALTDASKWNLMFLRHRSGPVYLWYEIAHPRFLRKTVDEFGQPGMTNADVVVDSHAEVLLRLRGLYGLKNTLGKRIVAVGGPSGWGAGGKTAPDVARDLWKLDIRTVGYPELGERIVRARGNAAVVKRSAAAAERFLNDKGVRLETSRDFVVKAFLLTEVFRDLLDEAQTDAITINQCMGTIMGMSETTACLPLSVLNDDGYMAFCESDFVVIPSGILLHGIANKPVFLNDPTHPHDGVVTLAHCTAPRKMDGVHSEPARILTHFESDYGAAPKVEMRKAQKVTNLVPDFHCKKWVGFTGDIVDVPFLEICRSQIDVGFQGDTEKLLGEMGGFHWMTSYGDYVLESEYALKKLGVDMVRI